MTKGKIFVMILIGLLIFGGVFYYRYYFEASRNFQESLNTTTSKSIQDAEADKLFKEAVQTAAVLDQDLDGLPDSEEKKLGTDPKLIDTDSDGLSDKDEVQIYKTNPLKADTDGDGFNDGYEVRHHMNPLVPNKK